jgi:nitroimidazol reductase NimA-like FMN-containing flavoprotein (pyridoxamine 5'-phosphate oxidase superfamily)
MKPESLAKIRNLFKSQTLAVLATFYESQPYCNLVAFAETPDCKSLIFTTNRNTSKYRNLLKNRQVSLLIDDRTNLSDDFGKKVAITALGLAEEVSPQEKSHFAELLISKHPDIAGFTKGSDNTLFQVRISDYLIAGFDSVEKLHIDDTSG